MKHILCAEHISKKIGKVELLHDISLELQGGNVYGFVGENGAGKTMLFRILCGLVKPTQGRVLLDGENIFQGHCSARIGVIIENSAMWSDMTGIENLLCLSSLNHYISKSDVIQAMTRVGLNPDNRLPVKKYSLGMKQRLMIAQAIMEKPDFIFLDEPTNSIDKDGAALIRSIILEEAKRGAVILIASHIDNDISPLCAEIYHMQSGICSKLGGKND